jgi:uncharacterized membrane protein YhhN
MNKNIWLFIFIASLIANLAGALLHNETVQAFSKPLIIISLGIYFITATQRQELVVKRWIVLALVFSWVGDIFLIFQINDPRYFILGLCSFLIAHLCYVFFFARIGAFESIKLRWWLLLSVLIYYGFLMMYLDSYLGDMKIPVRIYGVVISMMLMLALHMLYLKDKKAGLLMMTGALLFVVSDSVLAINKFYQSFEPAGFIIMLTYGMAQLFIVEGAIREFKTINL